MNKKKIILKKYTGKGGPTGPKLWQKYPSLVNAADGIDSIPAHMRDSKGYLPMPRGGEQQAFGSQMDDPGFVKGLRSLQEDKKISGFA